MAGGPMTDDERKLNNAVIAMAIGIAIVRIRQSEDTAEERLDASQRWADTLVKFTNDETWHP